MLVGWSLTSLFSTNTAISETTQKVEVNCFLRKLQERDLTMNILSGIGLFFETGNM